MISNIGFFKKMSLTLIALLAYDFFFPFSVLPLVGEFIVTVVSALCLIYLMIVFLYSYHGAKEREGFVNRYVALGALGIFLFLMLGLRAMTWDKLTWACNGVVTDKYISSNHAMRSIKVRGKEGATMEGVANELWQKVRMGATLQKTEWSEYGCLNGQGVRIVPEGLLLSLCGWRLPKNACR